MGLFRRCVFAWNEFSALPVECPSVGEDATLHVEI